MLRNPRILLWKIVHAVEMRRYDRILAERFLENPHKENTIILASYPKSGNTYLRFVFANIIGLRELEAPTIDYHRLDEMLPTDIFEEDLQKPWPYRSLPCILKTHNDYRNVYYDFRTIFLYRNPLDTMVSGYFYFKNRVGPPDHSSKRERFLAKLEPHTQPYTGTASQFLREHLDGWCLHYLSWIDRNTVQISYEQLKRSPVYSVTGLLDSLDIEIDENLIQQAVQSSDISRVRQLEEERGRSKKMAKLSGKFARSGEIGQWEDHFSQDDLDFFHSRLEAFDISLEDFDFE